MLSRRLGALAALASITALAACGGGASGTGADTPDGAPGGTLRLGVTELPPGQGNPFTAAGSPSIYTWSAIFDSLTIVDADGQTSASLATDWTNIDETTWEFTLRDDIAFSNGEEFNAEAVVTTVDYLVSDEGAATVVGNDLALLKGAEAVDELTVRLTTDSPDPILPTRLSVMSIVAPEAWTELGPDGFAAAPVGTGPFAVDSITQNEVKLSAFTDSWRAPQADAMTVTRLSDAAARLQALQSNQIDLAIGISPDQVEVLESSGYGIHTAPAQVMSLAFRQTLKDNPVADVRVRRALNHAVDRQAIVDSLLAGRGGVPTQGTTENTVGHNPDVTGFEYDPELATELLEEAGYGDGLELDAEIVVGSYAADSEIYQAAAADLAKVGVTLNLEQITFPEWLEKYQTDGWGDDVEVFGLSWNATPLMDASRPYTIFSCLRSPAFFCDKKVTPLLEEAQNEFDPEARTALLQDVATRMNENPPALFLTEQTDINATGQQVANYSVANRVIAYENITVQ